MIHDESNSVETQKMIEILQADPLWYMRPEVSRFVDTYVLGDTKGQDEEWRSERTRIVETFATLLKEGSVLLGDLPEGFNDDDRWYTGGFRKMPAANGQERPDTIVIHHTHTSGDASYWYINALGLLRLYLPLYRSGFPDYTGQRHPISSGHFFEGQQTFVGYHYLVYPDGNYLHPLKEEYIGFHSGDYPTNCRSLGLAVVNDLTESEPSQQVVNATISLLEIYRPVNVLGHREVQHKGVHINTECPGKTWEIWKQALLERKN